MDSPAPIALLVDAENIAHTHAPAILRIAAGLGELRLRRAYGAAEHLAAWDEHGLSPRPTRPGKNAADLLLCVDAMELALREGFGTILIASSDRDFTCLAERLRELGIRILGLGEAKAPRSFRAACSDFVTLGGPQPVAATPPAVPKTMAAAVSALVKGGGEAGIPIAALGPALQKRGFRVRETPEGNWRKWLAARPQQFCCDPKGPDARVRLRENG